MRIPSEQFKTVAGAIITVPLNGDYTYLQVTLHGRNTGVITPTIRPLLERNDTADFQADDFELVEDGAVDLAANPKKRTFTVEMKRLSALRLTDAGAGNYKYSIRQWGRASN